MFRTLAEKGINILMITTSEIKISVLVARQYAQEALHAVHEVFGLHEEPPETPPPPAPPAEAEQNTDEQIVARIERLEDLLIEDITLDESQSRVTMVDLPDMPGLAAQVFDEIAEAGIVVDMIVQSVGRRGRANVTFTVAQRDLEHSLEVAAELADRLGCPSPTNAPKVAKLSVFGVGMKSHTSVARRMFQSLADAGVNVDVISTSEVRINVVVDGRDGQKALAALRKEFADAML
jgi:aspartate kinase